MSDNRISLRQLLALLLAALLSPAVRLLPARTAEEAGAAGWLSSLVMLPVVLGLCWVMSALFRRAEEGDGLGEIIRRSLGRPLGTLVLTLYLLWGLFLLCANTRLFGLRFLSTSYRNAPMGVFLLTALLLVVWLIRKPLAVFARAGEIFCLALVLCLALCLVFGLFQVRAEHVLPVWWEDAPGVLRAGRPVLAVAGYGVFGAFLAGRVVRCPDGRRRSMKWAVVFCLLLTGLQLVCLGNFGPGLTARLEVPLFMMVKGIGVPGAFERVESVVVALWALSDLALLGLLASACCTIARTVFPIKKRGAAVLSVAALALVGGLFFFPDSFTLRRWMAQIGEWGSIAFGFFVPAVLLLILAVRCRRQK